MRTLFISITFSSITFLTQAQCNCQEEFSKIKNHLESNYAGFRDKVPAPIKDPPYVPPAVLPKTDNMRLKELKQMLIEGKGQQVVQKVLDIALEDGHPGQMAALKLCMERALPVSMFEKTAAQRAAVTINITGIGGPDAPAPQAEIIDVQMKDANG